MTDLPQPEYTVVRKTGVTHIQGLGEKSRGSSLNYALSACPALSRSNRWSPVGRTNDLTEALATARSHGVCRQCEARALELLANPNPMEDAGQNETNPLAATSLRDLGYLGSLDSNGLVSVIGMPTKLRQELTAAVADMLSGFPLSMSAPQFFLLTQVTDIVDRVAYLPTTQELLAELQNLGVSDSRNWTHGTVTTGDTTAWWGPVPPADDLTVLPTMATVHRFPEFWVCGPGSTLARLVSCPDGVPLTIPCAVCGERLNEDATAAAPTGRERDGEHWNARLIRAKDTRSRLAVVQSSATRMRDMITEEFGTARRELKTVEAQFAADIVAKGPVRATRLHAKNAMRWETTVAVWEHAMETGNSVGWTEALNAAQSIAVRLLHESVVPTRNAVDLALERVQGETAGKLLSEIRNLDTTA